MDSSVQFRFSSPGPALQDYDTVINIIDAVVAEIEKFSEVAGTKRETAQRLGSNTQWEHNHHRRSIQVWHMFSRDLTVLPAHPDVHPQSE